MFIKSILLITLSLDVCIPATFYLLFVIISLLQFYRIQSCQAHIIYRYAIVTLLEYFPAWFEVYICELKGFPEGPNLDSRSTVEIRMTGPCSM